jgi:hypothetical protein
MDCFVAYAPRNDAACSKTPNAVAIVATAFRWIGVGVCALQRHTRV